MAISIQPVDGLINRLLQQNGKAPPVAKQNPAAPIVKLDQLSISSSRTETTPSTESQIQTQQKAGERALESHLLNLYKKHDNYGG